MASGRKPVKRRVSTTIGGILPVQSAHRTRRRSTHGQPNLHRGYPAIVDRSPSVAAEARDAILAWYSVHGRSLAFRRTSDPYAVLVSEAMAQQTQAARAAEHWERFMRRFPTVESLAAAS